MKTKSYSLRKARHLLRQGMKWYHRKKNSLSKSDLGNYQTYLKKLDESIRLKNRDEINSQATQVESFISTHFQRSPVLYALEVAGALIFALVIALVVRQMWFELYEIPTGSMRPTFREKDRLTVSKTAYGINTPYLTDHFYFDDDLIQRGSVVIFSGDGIPLPDVDTKFLGFLPYKKRYIKRMIGKPGDTLYFYGGRVYVVDRNGNQVNELVEEPSLAYLEHIPMRDFDMRIANQRIARATSSYFGALGGEVFNGKEWIKDEGPKNLASHKQIQTYSDLWGLRNYAKARLLLPEEVKDYTDDVPDERAALYLQLFHTPHFSKGSPWNGIELSKYSTLIPLHPDHIETIMDNIYTARFVVNDERAERYSEAGRSSPRGRPKFPGVEDGTYEFYYGHATKVGMTGLSEELPKSHPLYSRDPENIQKLFNLGIEMNTRFNPNHTSLLPSRYAYFRNGDLYLLGAKVIEKDDPVLRAFHEKEQIREDQGNYVPFRDYGPPKNAEFIRTFGLEVPEGHYFVLGDNHAMSADSRYFGFVPEQNLQGAPSVIFWPPGDRWGFPNQRAYPLFVTPRLIVWSIAGVVLAIWGYITWRRNQEPIKF